MLGMQQSGQQGGALPAGHRPFTHSDDVAARREEPNVQEWDINNGPRKSGALERVTMALPAVTRVATNVVGGTFLSGGYAMGKVGELFSNDKAVDSAAFRHGVRSWMLSNGIVPHVEYEPMAENAGTGPEDLRQAPLIIANHTSYLDGLILASCLGFPRVVAMAGSRKVPVVGRMMEEMECVFVDRSNSDSRKATLEAIAEHCKAWRHGDRPMMIFPEGTTSNGEALLPFKRGAFTAGVPVRPVVLVYTGQWDPASTTYKATERGPEKMSDAEWAAQFAGTWIHSVHVRVLAPYEPSQEEQRDPDLYARNCQAHVAAALARVRAEVQQRSWKVAAGREDGGFGYRFGDLSRTLVKSAREALAQVCCLPDKRPSRPLDESEAVSVPDGAPSPS